MLPLRPDRERDRIWVAASTQPVVDIDLIFRGIAVAVDREQEAGHSFDVDAVTIRMLAEKRFNRSEHIRRP